MRAPRGLKLNEGYIQCRPFVTWENWVEIRGSRFEGKSRGGRRLVIACTTRNKNTAARRRTEEGGNGNFSGRDLQNQPLPSCPPVRSELRLIKGERLN